jgi:hypothetical protein
MQRAVEMSSTHASDLTDVHVLRSPISPALDMHALQSSGVMHMNMQRLRRLCPCMHTDVVCARYCRSKLNIGAG